MFVYEKKLQYPVKIKNPNPRLAAAIISQYGGPDGELGASLRYLSQRYSMPYPELKGLLTDIGTEELGHLEMVGTIVHQLTRNLTEEQIKEAGFEPYFVDHTTGVFPQFASGYHFNPRAPCGARQQKCTNHYAHFCDNRQISDAFAQNAACQGILLLFDAGKPCGFWVRTAQVISAHLCFAL